MVLKLKTLPTVTFGSETCNLTNRQTRKIRTMQRANERVMFNITWNNKKTTMWVRKQVVCGIS